MCLAPLKSDALTKESNNSHGGGKYWNDARSNAAVKAPAKVPADQQATGEMISPDGPKLKGIDVGSVVKIKGIISVYRERQIAMKIIHVLRDTAAEVAEWRSRNAFYEAVLAKPWVVTQEEETKCLKNAEREKWREDEREKRKIKKGETEDERKLRKKRERRGKRDKEAMEAKEAEEESKKDEKRKREQWERDEHVKRGRKRAEMSKRARVKGFQDRIGNVELG